MSITVARILILLLFFSQAEAGQLLLSLDLKTGPTTWVIEASLKEYFQFNLKKNYRKVYVITRTSDVSTNEALEAIKKDRQPGEMLDIVSIQHGPDISLFWDMGIEKFQELLGPQEIRFVMSSGCRMWGSVAYSSEGEISTAQRNHVVTRIENLHPREILLFTNDQSYLIYLAKPLLLMSESMDSLSDVFVPFFRSQDKQNTVKLFKLKTSLQKDSFFGKLWNSNTSVNPLARPVFIHSGLHGYSETILPLPQTLWTSLQDLCQTLATSDDARYQNMAKTICRFN